MSDAPTSNALKERKLKLVADPLDGAQQRNGRSVAPTLTIAVVDNQPRFTVYTNVEGDKQNGKIEGNMDSYTFYAVMELIKAVAKGEVTETVYVDNKGFFFDPISKKRSESPIVKSKTMIGRDEQGRVFIALTAKGRPLAKFHFAPSEYHNMVDAQGRPVSAGRVSEIYAAAFASVIGKLVASVLVTEHISEDEQKAKREANRGGGGGGYQNRNNNGGGGGYNKGGGYNGGGNRNNNGGGGGYQRRDEPAMGGGDFGDDIPF